MSERNIALYLEDIITSIKKIQKYTKDLTFEEFCRDEKTIDAVIRNIEVMGEAVRNMPEGFRKRYKEIPWSKIIAIRNKVIHEYFGVDLDIVWETLRKDLKNLQKQVEELKKDI